MTRATDCSDAKLVRADRSQRAHDGGYARELLRHRRRRAVRRPDDVMFSRDVLEPTVDLLAELVGGQAALELAVGTAAIALPLSEQAACTSTASSCRRPWSTSCGPSPAPNVSTWAIGDMTSTRVEGRFGASSRLQHHRQRHDPGRPGRGVRERRCSPSGPGLVPDRGRCTHVGERFAVFDHSAEHVGIDEHDSATQPPGRTTTRPPTV